MPMSSEEREELIRKIEAVIADPEITSGIVFSGKLFGKDGLFHALAVTGEERKELIKIDLFQRALRRLSELQRQDLINFDRNRRACACKQDADNYDPKIGQD